MNLTAKVKLVADPGQAELLRATLEGANDACNFISEAPWHSQTFRQFDLHKIAYRKVRERFDLHAAITVRCIAKVADTYKVDRKSRRTFRPHGCVPYDDRILRWFPDKRLVSISSLNGRVVIPFVCGSRDRELLKHRHGESDLALIDGCFYLLAACDVPEPDPIEPVDVLGVDLGIKQIAADSDGEMFSGALVNGLRKRHRRLRTKLQNKGTLSATRLLRSRRRKESRFARHINHEISKKIVSKAEDTKRAIALENLNGPGSQMTVRRPQRDIFSSWSFFQLKTFIDYKARLVGVPVVIVDRGNTSITCPLCGHIDRRNRKAQGLFLCTSCGLAGAADVIAAENIRRAALIVRPNVSDFGASAPKRAETSHVAASQGRLSTGGDPKPPRSIQSICR